MKIYIGPYRDWFGPYQLAGLLKYIGVSEDNCGKIAEKIPAKPFQWFHDTFQKREIKIRIDEYDTWSMDHALAMIIHPMLLQLQASKHGSPFVEDEDVPMNLRSTNAPPKENEWDTDDFFHNRWEWVMGEMIFAFECLSTNTWEDKYFNWDDVKNTGKDMIDELIDDDGYFNKDGKLKFDKEGYQKESARIRNGTRLFGVYYQGLWD